MKPNKSSEVVGYLIVLHQHLMTIEQTVAVHLIVEPLAVIREATANVSSLSVADAMHKLAHILAVSDESVSALSVFSIIF